MHLPAPTNTKDPVCGWGGWGGWQPVGMQQLGGGEGWQQPQAHALRGRAGAHKDPLPGCPHKGRAPSPCRLADLELGVLCLHGGMPGPSFCSIRGSMAEACSGVVAPLPWSVEWVLAGSRWELERGGEGRMRGSRPEPHPSSDNAGPKGGWGPRGSYPEAQGDAGASELGRAWPVTCRRRRSTSPLPRAHYVLNPEVLSDHLWPDACGTPVTREISVPFPWLMSRPPTKLQRARLLEPCLPLLSPAPRPTARGKTQAGAQGLLRTECA